MVGLSIDRYLCAEAEDGVPKVYASSFVSEPNKTFLVDQVIEGLNINIDHVVFHHRHCICYLADDLFLKTDLTHRIPLSDP